MRMIIFENEERGSKAISKLIANEIKLKPNIVLGLATGETMKPIYKELIKLYKKGEIDFSKVKTFNLDEYIGLYGNDKKSLRYFMEKNLFNKTNILSKNINFLDGKANDLNKECQRYEEKIKKEGGIDLQILGIGRNGHVAFNEPPSKNNTKTRSIKLSKKTLKDNFPKLKNPPQYALTMGIETIMKSQKIYFIAFGSKKSKIVKEAIEGKIKPEIPASYIQGHKNTTYMLDKKSSSKLRI